MKILSSILAGLVGTVLGKEISLTDSNFEKEMKKYDLALVKFYAPWCGHCKRMAPEFEKAAVKLANNDPPVQLVNVDCTDPGKDTCSKFGVSGYPTLKTFRNGGNAADYEGGRTENEMVKYMAERAGPASYEIKDSAKFDKLKSGAEPVVVGFFESESADGAKNYKDAAEALRGKVKFAHTYSADVAKSAEIELGNMVLYRPSKMKSKFEEQAVVYETKKWTVGLIKNWVKSNAAGLAPVLDPKGMEDQGFPLVLSIFSVDYELDPKGTQYWRNRVMKIATEFKDDKSKVKFAVASKDSWAGFLNEVGLTWTKEPLVVAFDDKDTKFVMEEKFTTDGAALREFVTKFNKGLLTPHLKTEAEPAEQGANKKLTASNFKKFVDGSKDAFVKFYAPWCGHCKTMAPKWEEFAKEHDSDDSVVIGDFDATANDVPAGFEVKGFPTLYWIPKGGEPVQYQGGREAKDFNAHLKKNRSAKDEL